jgi:threonine/homoserine/homoserine lactone efflux protein
MPAFTPDLLAAIALFGFASSITPGPNNTMLLASGANFGLRRTIPHLFGVSAGFFVLLVSVGLGMGALFAAYPILRDGLKLAGTVYLLWLAWKIATAKGLGGGPSATSDRPLTFAQAAAFQWVNPKAWAMALGAMTAYAPKGSPVLGPLGVACITGLVNMPCIAIWAAFGAMLRRFLDSPRVLRVFNLLMAALLVASLYPAVAELLRR